MNEAVFRFRASGDVDISSLEITYVGGTPVEEWCNPPYVVPVDDEYGNLYELHFRLEPFILTGGGASVRKCIVTGPIYIIPDYTHPVTTVNLTITQQACVEELSCDELASLINVYPNGDISVMPCDGGELGMIVDTGGYFDIQGTSNVYEADGVTPCSWARFDSTYGTIIFDRRGFDEHIGENRKCIVIYNFIYSAPYDIDRTPCEATYEGEIEQLPRTCEEADIRACAAGTDCLTDIEFTGSGERTINLESVIGSNGDDASTFNITSVTASGDAFRQYNPVAHGANGWLLYLNYNTDVYYKYGLLQVEYTNQYDTTCIKVFEFNVKMNGIMCNEVAPITQFGIQIDGGDTFYYDGSHIELDGNSHFVSISVIGDYANYFDIDEDASEIPFQLLPGSDHIFFVPANEDPTSSVVYTMKLVASVSDQQYDDTTIFGCSIEANFDFNQSIYEEIEPVGNQTAVVELECEEIGTIPSITTDYHQSDCDVIDLLSTDAVAFTGGCGEFVMLSTTDVSFYENCQTISLRSVDRPIFTQVCGTPVTLQSAQGVIFEQNCDSIQASITGSTTHSQSC